MCYQAFRLTDSKKVYTDDHSGISARQRDSKVSMTDLVCTEDTDIFGKGVDDHIGLCMSMGSLASS